MKYFKTIRHLFIFSLLLLTGGVAPLHAADQDNYTKIITKRAQKIVEQLQLDQGKAVHIRNIIVQQYRNLNEVHNRLSEEKEMYKSSLHKEQAEKKVASAQKSAAKQLVKLHRSYLKKLSEELNQEQVEQVKDEMTYKVAPITYAGYVDMLPQLTTTQKAQILTYLHEAREQAMDAGSSEEKHALFGKYKGKINNYLSKEGVETKIARQVWEKKLKEKQAR